MTEEGSNAERPGPRMLGHYEVLEQIGQGGMAVVYKGVQPSLNREVAVKVLPERFARTEELLARFDREANIAAQLNHPNIVQIIDRGKEGATLFIVMEYVKGQGLDKLIRDRQLSLAQMLDYSIQICDALEYAHGKGVIHRDLKPSNILVDVETGRAKISDFGIAQIETTDTGLSTLTKENVSLGTINYMSPEQRLDSHSVTHLTDIFSFGVMLYEMLTGKLPLGHFKLPSFVNNEVPIGFDSVVKKCLAQSPDDRFQSAAEIKATLSQITGRHLRSKKTAAVAPLPWWRRRRCLLAGAAALVPLAVGAVFLIRGFSARHGPQAGDDTVSAGSPVRVEFEGAQALISQGKNSEAIPILEKILQGNSAGAIAPEAQFALAQAHRAAGDYDTALKELEAFLRLHPDSPRAPEAVLEKCRIEWKTAPTHGASPRAYDSATQRKLVQELSEFVSTHPASEQVSDALSLVADICRQPDLNDWKTAADSLVSAYEHQPYAEPEPLFQAAELYDTKVGDWKLAATAYTRFVSDFPRDPRAEAVRKRLEARK